MAARPVSLNEQIAEVMRESALRENVYPGLISRGKLKQREADYCMDRLRAVLDTLLWLRNNEHLIKQRLGS